MKFGKNLAHLLIPEWKDYNLDYNDLKLCVREVTQLAECDLLGLEAKFSLNFEYLNLFHSTKIGEISRKVAHYSNTLSAILGATADPASRFAKVNQLHYEVVNDVAAELRKLTRFVLVQKIAVKKICKKFIKHHPDRAASVALVDRVTLGLHTRPSFANHDIGPLAQLLSDLLNALESHLKALQAQLDRTVRSSTLSQQSIYEPVSTDVLTAQVCKFDLVTMLKKNFSIHMLLPKDSTARADLALNLNVYLQMPRLEEQTRILVVYLTAAVNDPNPLYILSYADHPVSVVVVHTGGLRKHSYCCVPNAVAQALLQSKALNTQQMELSDYLRSDCVSPMTHTALTSLLESAVAPLLKVVMTRSRYFLYKDPLHDLPPFTPLHSLTDIHAAALAPLTVDSKVYGDNYYMLLDEDIYTSNNVGSTINYDTDGMDPFPFNTFAVHSNDTNLHAFEASLTTSINGNVLDSVVRPVALRRIPVKLQNFVRNRLVHLFKLFELLDYMRLCYFNVIPETANNHYLKLLTLNLLKKHEQTVSETPIDEFLIHDKTRVILHRQKLYRSLTEEHIGYLPYVKTQDGCKGRDKDAFGYGAMFGIDVLDEDSYLVYLAYNSDLEENPLNSIVLALMRLRRQFSRIAPRKLLMDYESANYDSMNDEPLYYSSTNDFRRQLTHDYDSMLAILYFMLCFTALFMAGINFGIIFGILKLQREDVRLDVAENIVVVFLLAAGFLVALLFSICSIKLLGQRFNNLPTHSSIVWTILAMVGASIVSASLLAIP